jgi:elongation factor G
MELLVAGDIGAGVGFKDIRTGDTLCDENTYSFGINGFP